MPNCWWSKLNMRVKIYFENWLTQWKKLFKKEYSGNLQLFLSHTHTHTHRCFFIWNIITFKNTISVCILKYLWKKTPSFELTPHIRMYITWLVMQEKMIHFKLCKYKVFTQLCLTLCDPMDCSPPGSSVHVILQARILESVAIPFSRGSSQLRDQTQVSRTVGRFFTIWEPGKTFNWPSSKILYEGKNGFTKNKGKSFKNLNLKIFNAPSPVERNQ